MLILPRLCRAHGHFLRGVLGYGPMRTSDPAKREASVDADTFLLDETVGEYRPQAGPAPCEPDEAGCSGKERTAKRAYPDL